MTAAVRAQIASLPHRMGEDVRRAYGRKAGKKGVEEANRWLLGLSGRVPEALDLNASDADLKDMAEKLAAFVGDMRNSVRLEWLAAFTARRGVAMPDGDDEAAQWARASDAGWWRRQLRRAVAMRCEEIAIDVGRVSRMTGLYCSNDAMRRRAAQKRRNNALLESMQAVNELGQAYTLAELAQVSVSKPAIRRAELMTRIAGFEMVAKSVGHVAEFYTLTCPSKFHAVSVDGENSKYDPTLKPREGQRHLCRVWSRIRSELHRRGIAIYGFRVVEPHHDGTPHWHMLMFMEQRHVETVREVMRKHALAVDGNEPGAAERRFTVKAIDWSEGTAVGYIAKYICKNVDGEKPDGSSGGEDHECSGMDMRESAARVDGWAATHRFRQFQQIGGAPVTIWRELRRWRAGERDEAEQLSDALWRELRGLPPAPPSIIEQAAAAADGGHWNTFIRLMGGATVKRADLPLRLLKIDPKEARNRYGEERQDVTKGVFEEATGQVVITRVHEWVLQRSGEAASPRSPVNNCTPELAARHKPALKPEWLEWMTSINSGQPMTEPEELRGVWSTRFFEWEMATTATAEAIRQAGTVAEYIQQQQDNASQVRRVSWALVKGRGANPHWKTAGIAGINAHERTRQTDSGRAGTEQGQHDERTGSGQSVCSADRRNGQGAGIRPAGSVAHAGRAQSSNRTAADAVERALQWLKATC